MLLNDGSEILVKHYLPGRARLLVPWLKKDKTGLAQVLQTMGSVPGIKRAAGNSATGRLLILYEEELQSFESVLSFVRKALAGEPGEERPRREEKNNVTEQKQKVKEPEDLPALYQVLNVVLVGAVLGFFTLKQVTVGKSSLARSKRLFNLAAATAVISGYPVFRSGFKNLAARGRFNHDLAIGAFSLGTLLVRESIPGLLVVWLVNLNSLIQSLVSARSRKYMKDFMAGNGPAGKERLEITGSFKDAPRVRTPAEEYAGRIVPVSLGLAAVGAVTTGDFNTALASLLAASPAPAGLARPEAFSASMALAMKRGVLVRRPAAFARLKDVDSVVFDGSNLPGCRPEVVEVLPLPGYRPAELIALAQHALQSNHAKETGSGRIFNASPGGIAASLEGQSVLLGNREYISQAGVDTHPALIKEKRLMLRRRFPLYVALNGALAGVLGLKQNISAGTREAIHKLRSRGIAGFYMFAGANDPAASSLAGELGFTILPPFQNGQVKDFISDLQRAGSVVAAVGYGRGNTGELNAADVKIVFKKPPGRFHPGEADIILERNNLNLLSEAMALSFIASKKEHQNVEITSVLNTLGLALALSRILSPVGAAFYNNAISIAVSLNSLKLLYKQPTAHPTDLSEPLLVLEKPFAGKRET